MGHVACCLAGQELRHVLQLLEWVGAQEPREWWLWLCLQLFHLQLLRLCLCCLQLWAGQMLLWVWLVRVQQRPRGEANLQAWLGVLWVLWMLLDGAWAQTGWACLQAQQSWSRQVQQQLRKGVWLGPSACLLEFVAAPAQVKKRRLGPVLTVLLLVPHHVLHHVLPLVLFHALAVPHHAPPVLLPVLAVPRHMAPHSLVRCLHWAVCSRLLNQSPLLAPLLVLSQSVAGLCAVVQPLAAPARCKL